MNKLSGYKEVTIPSTGEVIELKFSNGTTEIFADLMGLATLEEVDNALKLDIGVALADGSTDEKAFSKAITPQYLKAIRLFVYAAAKYAALVQKKPINFNEWSPSEWFQEVGISTFLGATDTPEEAPKKNEVEVPANQ